jgi:hypothetical protein
LIDLETLIAEMRQRDLDKIKRLKKQADEFKIKSERYGYGPWTSVCGRFNRMVQCSHLKGVLYDGQREHKYAQSRPTLDYNVGMHQFIDGSVRIRCLNGCGWEVWKTPNTMFKWAAGLRMVKQSSNTFSSSERPLSVLDEVTT